MKFKFLLVLMSFVLIGGSAGTAYYFYNKYDSAQKALDNPDLLAQNEVKQLTDRLGKLIILPEDEEPTVATVLDKEKLTDQTFFAKSENGDKVIIYTKAMKAILYRPSQNKIIEVAPIAIDQPPAQPSEKPAAEKQIEDNTETATPAANE